MTVLATEATTGRRYTPEDLLTMPDGDHFELVDGELVEVEMGGTASWTAGEVHGQFRDFNKQARCGWVLPEGTSYQCFGEAEDRVRRPDTSFIRYGRLSEQRLPDGHIRIAPDLAVEVVSPNDLFIEVREKVEEYLRAGVRLVWVIEPESRTIELFRPDGSVAMLRKEQELDGEDVLPGFRCAVAALFPPEEPSSAAA